LRVLGFAGSGVNNPKTRQRMQQARVECSEARTFCRA
jgi:hypothetical protein